MSLFAIGDTHLSLSSSKPMDIFRGWQDYTARLEKNWRAVVCDADTVCIPGDISWAMRPDDAVRDLLFLNGLPGRKIIGKGNHDYWWCTMAKLGELKEKYGLDKIDFLFNNAYEVGEYAVCGTRGWFFDAESDDVTKVLAREAGRLRRSIEAALALEKKPLVFLHYPVCYDGRQCSELIAVLKEYGIDRCWFGHIHGDTSGRYLKYEQDGINYHLISADALGFMPKLIL